MLLAPTDMLDHTDICEHAMEKLRNSNVKTVYIVGRRGLQSAAFSIKELRELSQIDDTIVRIDRRDVQESLDSHKPNEKVPRAIKRKMDLMLRLADESDDTAVTDDEKSFHFKFLSSPLRIVESQHGNGRCGGIEFARSQITVDENGKESVSASSETETIDSGLVLVSIGYKSERLSGLPFDQRRAVVPSVHGRVIQDISMLEDEDDAPQTLHGLYVSGWLKRGPSGIIASNIVDSKETVSSIIEDLPTLASMSEADSKLGAAMVRPLLDERGVFVIDNARWSIVRQAEEERGHDHGKPREKFTSIEDIKKLVAAAATAPSSTYS
jgi:NADPH-dependent glutamate synthase beta subunit-like oxidoreductase